MQGSKIFLVGLLIHIALQPFLELLPRLGPLGIDTWLEAALLLSIIKFRKWNKMDFTILAFLTGILMMGLINSPNMHELKNLAHGTALYFLVRRVPTDKWKYIILTVILSFTIAGLGVLTNYGTNNIGHVLAVFIPLIAFIPSVTKYIAGAMSFLTIITVNSRGAVLASLIAIFLWLKTESRKLAMLGVLLLLLASIPLAGTVIDKFLSRGEKETGASKSLYNRLSMLKAAARMSLDNPLGVGTGNAINRLGEYRTDDFTKDQVIHNTFMTVLAENSLPVLILFLTVLGTAFYAPSRPVKYSIIIIAFICLFSELLWTAGIWIVLGLAGASYDTYV